MEARYQLIVASAIVTSARAFGGLRTEWIVDAIFRGTEGIQYAQLVNAWDLTQQKTLAVDVLTDRKRFERL